MLQITGTFAYIVPNNAKLVSKSCLVFSVSTHMTPSVTGDTGHSPPLTRTREPLPPFQVTVA